MSGGASAGNMMPPGSHPNNDVLNGTDSASYEACGPNSEQFLLRQSPEGDGDDDWNEEEETMRQLKNQFVQDLFLSSLAKRGPSAQAMEELAVDKEEGRTQLADNVVSIRKSKETDSTTLSPPL